MKKSDFLFLHHNLSSISGYSIFRFRLFSNKSNLFAVITDLFVPERLGGPFGQSITNSIESVVNQLTYEGFICSNSTRIIEHYENCFFDNGTCHNEFDLVEFNSIHGTNWRSLSHAKILDLLDCDHSEFANPTLNDYTKQDQFVRLKSLLPPDKFSCFGNHEQNLEFERIRKVMKPKEVLDKLINENASERTLQNFLKQDLSFFGEVYSCPTYEYICFSEFPVGDTGKVDFAVFTGRSRMDVYLIEVKGADISLLTNDARPKVRAIINSGIQQLEDRETYINNHYEEFRKEVHQIRQAVEHGSKLYNSFPGALLPLQVDPNKDIKVHYVLIAGRSGDDHVDSSFRHRKEYHTILTHLETWDSFSKKLRRTESIVLPVWLS